MHTRDIRVSLLTAVSLDEQQLSALGVRSLLVDSVELGDTSVDVHLSIEDSADDCEVLRYIASV